MSYEPHDDNNRTNDHNSRSDYRWSYEDYEAATHRSSKKLSIAAVIGWASAAFVVVCILGLSVYGAYSLANGSVVLDKNEAQSAPASPKEDDIVSQEQETARPEQMLTIIDPPEGSDKGLDTVDIVKKVRSCVVGITVYDSRSTISPSGHGSGIVMNESGYIITNEHVVANAIGINVELDNGDTYVARLIGSDKKTDLAVIRIEAEGLSPAQFGNSDELEAGERVVAIGNPGGSSLAGSVTQGIVSAVNRVIGIGTYSTSFIQTDAAINPGNSGGALINVYGQIIGINSSKIADVQYEGIGFAIPINEAKPVIDDLISYGHVKGRTKIGITGQEINATVSQLNNMPIGIYIVTIEPQSDLAGQSVMPGDVITHIDGGRIETFADISTVLKTRKPGDTVTVTLYRAARGVIDSGKTFDVDIALMEDIG